MSVNFKYYLLLTRPLNLAIIAGTQWVFIFHSAAYDLGSIRFQQALLVTLATLFTAAAGNVINDLFDIEEDQINNPEKRIIARKISIPNARIFYAVLVVLSLTTGFISGLTMGLLALSIGILLYFYSSDLKGSTLWGNLMIAFMTGAVVFTADLGVYTRVDGYFAEYALLAFLITLPREIVKDIEDLEGDKLQEYKTFPIVFGIRKSALLAGFVLLAMAAAAMYLVIVYGNLFYNIFTVSFVVIPAIAIAAMLPFAKEKKQFHRISVYLKALMVTGILSVLGL